VKTGGELYEWWDGGNWTRWHKHAHADGRAFVDVNDKRLIAKLDHIIDHAEKKAEKKKAEHEQKRSREYDKQHGDGVRIYDKDGKKFFNIAVGQDFKDPDVAHINLKLNGQWTYHFVVEGPDMDLFEDTVTGWRPKD